jgi:6-pyruvoyl tetrahydropterin synthase/QueD family protein
MYPKSRYFIRLIKGHNYTLDVLVKSVLEDGMVINATILKEILQNVVDRLDHRNLNEIDYFYQNPPTVEILSVYLWKEIRKLLDPSIDLIVELHETDTIKAIFSGEFR